MHGAYINEGGGGGYDATRAKTISGMENKNKYPRLLFLLILNFRRVESHKRTYRFDLLFVDTASKAIAPWSSIIASQPIVVRYPS